MKYKVEVSNLCVALCRRVNVCRPGGGCLSSVDGAALVFAILRLALSYDDVVFGVPHNTTTAPCGGSYNVASFSTQRATHYYTGAVSRRNSPIQEHMG